jgi:UDP-glucose 4-epimerase
MTRRIVITGGFGYIGGRAAQHLAALGEYEIVLATRGAAEPPTWLPQAMVVKVDWDSASQLESLCNGADAVLHLAGMNEIDCAADPVGALVTNAVATARLVGAAKKACVRRFVYLSTAHIYGAPLAGVITEMTVPRPAHPYASSHRAAEDCVLMLHDSGHIEGIVLRLSNGFGTPAHPTVNRWTLLVNDLCRQAVTQRRMVLRSHGLQQRDFITLTDTSRALGHCLSLPVSSIGDGLFNVGGGCSLRVRDIVREITERCDVILGFCPEVAYAPMLEETAPAALDYRIDKFLATGFRLSGSRSAEIDATLKFCDQHFSLNS